MLLRIIIGLFMITAIAHANEDLQGLPATPIFEGSNRDQLIVPYDYDEKRSGDERAVIENLTDGLITY